MSDPAELQPVEASEPIVRRPILVRLGLAFVGALVGFVAIDRGVAFWDRAQGGETSGGAMVQHAELGWTNRPHYVNEAFETRLDRFGLRNPEIPVDAPPTEVRIAGFGASRLYGAGGAHQPVCWNYALEEELADARYESVRVLNGGVMAYSVVQAARRAALLLDALEPDIVFVTITPGTQMLLDVSSKKNVARYGPEPDDLVPADLVGGLPEALWPSVAGVHGFLMESSGIYRRHRAGFQVGGERILEMQRWLLSKAPHSAAIDVLLDATLDELERLHAECRARGADFFLALMPESQQDSDEVWQRFLRDKQGAGAPPIGTPRDEPTRELARLLEARELPYFDFTAEIDRMGSARARYFVASEDFHRSEAGHRVFAEGLARRLRTSGRLGRAIERRAADPRSRPFGPSPFEGEVPERRPGGEPSVDRD